MTGALAALCLTLFCGQASTSVQKPEVLAEVRIHGNHITADIEIIKLAEIVIGAPIGPTTLEDIRRRLRDTGKFDDVQVLKRFASIDDPSRILVVIIVNEGPVRIDIPDDPTAPIRVVRRRGLRNLMFLPILEFEDGYTATGGVRLALVNVGGELGRVSFPLTVGGTRQAGVQYDLTLRSGPLSRIEFGAAVQRRKNPAFEEFDRRNRLWARVERRIGPLRAGATAGWSDVSFADLDDEFRSFGADVAIDTRLDPLLPRNAVFTTVSWERLDFSSGGTTNRARVDARGYLGIIGQTVLVARALHEDASRPLPPYLQSLLGGWSNLRGFEAGAFVGDTLTAGSLELRVPLSSALNVGRLGVSGFVDAGKAYFKGQRFDDQPWHVGVGGSVWMTATVIKLSFSVARGLGTGTRVNFGGGLTF